MENIHSFNAALAPPSAAAPTILDVESTSITVDVSSLWSVNVAVGVLQLVPLAEADVSHQLSSGLPQLIAFADDQFASNQTIDTALTEESVIVLVSGLTPVTVYAVRILLANSIGSSNGSINFVTTLTSDDASVHLAFEADFTVVFGPEPKAAGGLQSNKCWLIIVRRS